VALLAPLAVFAAAYFQAMTERGQVPPPPDELVSRIMQIVFLGAVLTELVAVSLATFLLLFRPRYISVMNVVMTLLGAIPLVLLGFVVFILKFGHFHI